jgi:copper chaperone CopZ
MSMAEVNRGRVELTVTGMTCGHCEMRVHDALAGVPGVKSVSVKRKRERAVVKLDGTAPVDTEALTKAVRDAGYSASIIDK